MSLKRIIYLLWNFINDYERVIVYTIIKRIILLFIICFWTVGFNTLMLFAVEGAFIVGDINCDNSINAVDALMVLKHSAKIELIDENANCIADVDGDLKIDALDALEILKKAAGIIDRFPVETSNTSEPLYTIAPTATHYAEQTQLPVFNGETVSVKELNDVALVEGDEIIFLSPDKKYSGVEMINPFSGMDITEGVTLSFWFKPNASYFATDKGYTSLMIFVNELQNEMLKFDAEGTYQYSDEVNKFKASMSEFAISKGEYYYITCVIEPSGVKYYADGKLIKNASFSGTNENYAYTKLLPLLSNVHTKLYIGGSDSLYFMAGISRHALSEGSIVKNVTAYTYPLTAEEVYSLYYVESNKEDSQLPDDFSGKVWIIGDSIAAYHEKIASVRPLFGWGEIIGEYFTDDIRFYNMGISSQSTSSYYSIRRPIYDYAFNNIGENDYVIISFGHNDHNAGKLEDFNRMTSPSDGSEIEYSFKWWLKNYYIDPVLEKGATPILMSAVVRCSYRVYAFYEESLHLEYGKAMKELVEEYKEKGIEIYYINAQDYTYNLYSSISMDEAKLLHGQYGSESGNFFDNTHYSEAGARMIAEYIISQFKLSDLSIKEYIIEK